MIQQPMLEENHWKLWLEARDTQAAEALVIAYSPLVDYHVHRIAAGLPSSISKEELKSLGMIGLFDALWKFDPERDLKFNTYASFRIKGAILDGLRKQDWLPRSVREKTKRIESTIEKLEQKYLRHITAAEVAEELNLTEQEVLETLQENTIANLILLDDHKKEQERENHVHLEDKKTPTPEQQYIKQELVGELGEALKRLSEKEQLVISFFYDQELTFTEIGQILGLSTSRISQIHSKALYKLRNVLEKYL